VTLTALVSTLVSEQTEEFDPNTVTPGFVGFAVMALIGVVTILLVLDMVRRVRRTRYRDQVREELLQEEREHDLQEHPEDQD